MNRLKFKTPVKRKAYVISGGGKKRKKKKRKLNKKKKKKRAPKQIKYTKPILIVKPIQNSQILSNAINSKTYIFVEDNIKYKKSDIESIRNLAIKEDLLFIGREYPQGGPKSFICTNLQTFVEKTRKSNPFKLRFHEMFIETRLTKGVFDIEIERECNKDLDFVGFLYYFINQLVVYFHSFGLTDVHQSWFLVEYATREEKFSAHVTMYEGYVFKTMNTWLKFSTSFIGWLGNKEIVKLQTLKRQNQNNYLDHKQKRISMFARDKDFREITPPSQQYPFGHIGEEEEVSHNVYLFKSLVDFQPFGPGTHSLRCYFSTKPKHETDERYRLKLATVQIINERTKEYRITIESSLRPKMIPHLLRQCIFPMVGNIKTRVIEISNSTQVDDNKIYCETRTPKYTSSFYKLYKDSGIQDSATLADIVGNGLKMGVNDDDSIFRIFCSLYDRSFNFGGNSYSFRNQENRYNIKLNRFQNQELYECLGKVVLEYSNSLYIRQLFKGPVNVILTMVKTNHKKTALLLNIKSKCEIVMASLKRRHEEHKKQEFDPGLSLKLWIETGKCYQECLKDICKGQGSNGKFKKGHTFIVRKQFMEIIRKNVSLIKI